MEDKRVKNLPLLLYWHLAGWHEKRQTDKIFHQRLLNMLIKSRISNLKKVFIDLLKIEDKLRW